ncbi:MAG: DUF4350 domain-containing protein [Planctomycetota bacterium]
MTGEEAHRSTLPLLLGWLGLACLSGAWVLAVGFHGSTHWAWWSSLALSGAILLSWVPLRLPQPRDAVVAAILVWLAALLLAALVLPWPGLLGPLAVGVGLVLAALHVRWPWCGRIGRIFVLAGTVWLLLGIVMFGYEALTARSPLLPPLLTEILAFLARLAGIDVAVDGGNLVLFSMRAKHPLAATWTLFADPASVGFLIGGLVLIVLASARRRRLRPAATLAVSMCLWLVLRTVLLMAIYLNLVLRTDYNAPLEHAGMFWSWWVQLLLLVPAVLLAWRLAGVAPVAPVTAEPGDVPGHVRRWRLAAGAAMAFVAALVLTMTVVWKPSGPRKAGRILVDEHHCRIDDWSKWRWPHKEFDTTSTLRAYDTDWYGEESGYNYASLYEYCSRFYTMARLTQPIDSAVLGTCDVLVLKVASRYFSQEEIDAVQRFVDAGGGLLLIGEHTSVFGSGVCLNQIARGYGFEFRYDCLFGMDEVFQQEYTPPLVPHPVVQHMGTMDFAISCSIDPGLSAGCAVIRDNGLKSLDADYHQSNFYPQPNDRPEMLHGAFVQLWATSAGDGRVLAFTDSTIFANFAVFERGKAELFLGMLEWLNHRGGPSLWWLAILGIALAVGAVILARDGSVAVVVLLGASVLGSTVGITCTRALHGSGMPVLEPQRPMVKVAFETDPAPHDYRSGDPKSLCPSIELPVAGFVGGNANGFGLFERSVQRLTKRHDATDPGKTWMSLRAGVEAALDADPDLVIFIHPTEIATPAQKDLIRSYVAAGGKLLVLDSPANASSSANELLAGFGVSVNPVTLRGEATTGEGLPPLPLEEALPVFGGTPFVWVDGKPVAAWVRHRKGMVVVLGFGSRFSDAKMGATANVIPDEAVRRVYEFEYALLRAIVDDSLPSR